MPCEYCHDTGWRVAPGQDAGRVERCACWRQSVAQTLLSGALIPPRYRNCELDTFVTYPNPQLLQALERAPHHVTFLVGGTATEQAYGEECDERTAQRVPDDTVARVGVNV